MSDIEKLANTHVAAMSAYVPGLQPTEPGWVKLNTNELPTQPSPLIMDAIQKELAKGAERLRLYPSPNSAPLREALAEYHRMSIEEVLAGNGCDDVLNILCRVFAGADKAIGMTVPSYSLYSVLAQAQGAELIRVEFDRSMRLPVEAIASCSANLFFLTCPNAPTGVCFPLESIREAASKFNGIFVVDETYAPFAQSDAVGLFNELPNVVIARSFSKAFGLAGLRVGYALASAEIIDLMDRVRDSYNLDRLAQAGALAALGDKEYYSRVIAETKKLREQMQTWYEQLGWFTYNSQTNFHFTEPLDAEGKSGAAVAQSLYEYLLGQKILVRSFPKHALTQSFLRISVGSELEMNSLKQAITSWQQTTANA